MFAGAAERFTVWTLTRLSAEVPTRSSTTVVPTPQSVIVPVTVIWQFCAEMSISSENRVEASTTKEFVADHAVSGVGALLTAL